MRHLKIIAFCFYIQNHSIYLIGKAGNFFSWLNVLPLTLCSNKQVPAYKVQTKGLWQRLSPSASPNNRHPKLPAERRQIPGHTCDFQWAQLQEHYCKTTCDRQKFNFSSYKSCVPACLHFGSKLKIITKNLGNLTEPVKHKDVNIGIWEDKSSVTETVVGVVRRYHISHSCLKWWYKQCEACSVFLIYRTTTPTSAAEVGFKKRLKETAASFRNNTETEKFYTGTLPTAGWILSFVLLSKLKETVFLLQTPLDSIQEK